MPASPVPIFDASRLERRSMGDPRLKLELVALFILELERLMAQVGAAPDAKARGERLQAVVALARSIGASRLALAAQRAEAQVEPDLHALANIVAETIAFVRDARF